MLSGAFSFHFKAFKDGAFRTCPTSHSRPNARLAPNASLRKQGMGVWQGLAGQAGGKASCILGVIPPLWFHHGDKVS